jgi:preprotein translocase subunit SecG
LVLRGVDEAAMQGGTARSGRLNFSMNAQTFFRTIGFLIILFLVVYVSIENTQIIDFRFSMLADKPLRSSAAIIYFAMFAVGVIGGTLLHNSGGKSGGRGSESGGKRK